jgi:hypothetical protein
VEAKEFKVEEVLRRNERFVVPLYQRQYQWHDDYDGGRAAAFWNDVAAKAGDVLEGTARFEHYMGALLLAPGGSPRAYGMTPVMQVVDGQQRLTTFLILLAALREAARRNDFHELADQCAKYLFNEPGKSDTDDLVRFKLTPTPVDREVFLDLLDRNAGEIRTKYTAQGRYWGGAVPKNTPFRALRAYEFFLARVVEFIESGPGEDVETVGSEGGDAVEREVPETDEGLIHDRLGALIEALVFHLKLIVITLGEEDDAQVVFETLNSAGQPLLAMDLVRNNIFHRAEAQHGGEGKGRANAEKLYETVWQPFDDGWWREPAPNARPRRPRIDHFLAHVLTAETGERTTVRELYAEYRAWASPKRKPRFERVEEELAILQRHAPAYEALEGRGDGDGAIPWLGRRLQLWQNTTAYPVALQVAGPDVPEEEGRTIARLLDSYLARRIICGLTPKNLNLVFPRLAGAMLKHGASVETLRAFYAALPADTTRFPTDAELTTAIVETRAYGRIPSRILADILWSLELASRSSMTEDAPRPPSLWVEHVMPQSWHGHWPLDIKAPTQQDGPLHWKRDAAIQTLGNLTIVTDQLNRSLGTLPFRQKVEKLVEHSNLTLNRKIAARASWDEEAIRDRGCSLAALAVEIWPSLDA